MPESLRARLLVLYALVVLVVVTAFGASVCYVFWRSLVSQVDAELTTRATTLSRALRPAGTDTFDLDLPEDVTHYFQEAGERSWYAIWDANGAQIDVSDPQATTRKPSASGITTRAGRREVVMAGPSRSVILISRDLSDQRAAVQSLALTVAAAGAVAIALSLACAWFLAGRALAPIARINETARAMAEGDLSARIPVGRTQSELGQVALALNMAFDRLEAALERQRRFTADASHELRTPLATLTVESEWALSRDRPPADYRESLTICRKAAVRMRGVVEQLLTLARADADDLPVERVNVRLDEIVEDVVGLIRPVAERRGIKLVNRVPPVEVVGDPGRLRERSPTWSPMRSSTTRRTAAWTSPARSTEALSSYGCAIRARAFSRTICRTSSNVSTAAIGRAPRMAASASGSPSRRPSSNDTVERFPAPASLAQGPRSSCGCQPGNRKTIPRFAARRDERSTHQDWRTLTV